MYPIYESVFIWRQTQYASYVASAMNGLETPNQITL